MAIKLSTKGQVALPSRIRKTLGLKAGDSFYVALEGSRIILTPKRMQRHRGRVVADPTSGLPMLDAGEDAPKLTSGEVRELLADFP